jgi:hypothetical protein
MLHPFTVQHLDVEKLLLNWRWLCADEVALIARNAFADLFLLTKEGNVLRLDISAGKLTKVAESEDQFRKLAETKEKREEWFAESDEQIAASRGLKPATNQCIAFATPLAFAESASSNKPFVVDIYEQVGFSGDMHRQLSQLPEGTKVRLKVVP